MPNFTKKEQMLIDELVDSYLELLEKQNNEPDYPNGLAYYDSSSAVNERLLFWPQIELKHGKSIRDEVYDIVQDIITHPLMGGSLWDRRFK